jgi:uroporphyrinogen III methyltransferase/synthase
MSDRYAPQVSLVGAGPGSPGLLTVRAAELLAAADFVIYDQLVPRRILEAVNPAAECVCVRDLPGKHPDKYPVIFDLMIERAKAGRSVVRLKGGDPLVFGRGGEEIEALQNAGIRYEIVPGVTAALAAAAYLDIPLTHRRHASAVAMITGHELPNKTGNVLNWKALAKFPGTLAIYMGVARLPALVAELLKHGKDPNTPSCLVERAGTGAMRSVSARLADLDEARRQAGLEAPGLIMIGDVVGLRHDPSWFESRPLFGQRVLVTRPRHQADSMVRRLEMLGAVPVLLPGIDLREPSDWGPLDAAIDRLAEGGWDWIAFTSANAVRFFLNRLLSRNRDIRSLGSVKLAAVGAKTAESLQDYRLAADLIPDSGFSGRALADCLLPHVRGARILLPRAGSGNDDFRQALADHADVHVVTAYEQVPTLTADDEILAAMRRGEIRFVTLASANTARAVLAMFDEVLRGRITRGEMQIVTISRDVAAVVESHGLPVAAIADRATSEGLITAVIQLTERS